MKKKTVFIFTLFCLCCTFAAAQRITTNEKYPINIIQIDGGTIHIAPIGWSQNGYFAYAIYEDNWNARGSFKRSEVTIFDAVTDKIVENYESGAAYNDDESSVGEVLSLEDFWLSEKHNITEMLRRHNIISVPNLPMEENLSVYGLGAEFQIDPPNAEPGLDYSHDNLIITNRSGEKKQIAEVGNMYTSVQILGFFKSPFENRIVFYLRIKYVGSPSQGEVYYKLVGCHLTVGFE